MAHPLPPSETSAGAMAVADMGSNQFKLIFGRMAAGRYRELAIEKRIVGAGDDLQRHGALSPGKLKQIARVLADFKRKAAARNLPLRGVATAAFREAPNRGEVARLAKGLGLPLEIASAKRESELAYLTATLGAPGHAVVDLGSRTIELVTRTAGGRYRWEMVRLGYRVAYERHFRRARNFDRGAASFRAELAQALPDLGWLRGKKSLRGIEIDGLADFLRPGQAGSKDGARLSRREIRAAALRLSALDPASFRRLALAGRGDRFLSRLVFVDFLLEKTGYAGILAVDREVGVGLIVESSQDTSSRRPGRLRARSRAQHRLHSPRAASRRRT